MQNGDLRLNPASVSKIFTAAVAVQLMGPDMRFPTVVSAIGDGPGIEVLLVTPGGDPTLEAADIEALARCVREKGVRFVGELVVESGPFTSASEPPAYDRKDTLAPYRAGVAALQIDRGAVTLTVSAGRPGGPVNVALSSSSDRILVENGAITSGNPPGPKASIGGSGAKRNSATATSAAVGTKGPKGRNTRFALSATVDADARLVLKLTGTFVSRNPIVQSFRVPDPGGHAVGVFRRALATAGVQVKDGPPLAAAPSGLRVLLPMLKDSINPIAEAVLRLAGAQSSGGKPVGFSEGARALVSFLNQRVGIPAGSVGFSNGSGLYDANVVTARAAVSLVGWLRKNPVGEVVLQALPVSGVDGTLKRRLKGTSLEGHVRAKTGTLDDAVTLAGTVDLPGGGFVEFAVLANAPECRPEAQKRGRCRALDRFAARKATDEALLQVWNAFAGPR